MPGTEAPWRVKREAMAGERKLPRVGALVPSPGAAGAPGRLPAALAKEEPRVTQEVKAAPREARAFLARGALRQLQVLQAQVQKAAKVARAASASAAKPASRTRAKAVSRAGEEAANRTAAQAAPWSHLGWTVISAPTR